MIAVFGLCVGWPDPQRPAAVKPRLPQSAVLHREQYGTATEAADVAAYDQRLNLFQADQGLAEQGWSPVQIERLREARSLGPRAGLRDAIRASGFELR